MTKIGVIGVGQMGSAIIKGLKKDATNKIIGENPVNPRVSRLAEKLDFKLVHAIHDLINLDLDYVFLTTPAKITLQIIPELINLDAKTTIISSVAGVGYNNLENILPNHSIIRIIPNTPVAINAGTIGLFIPANISKINAVKITHFLEQLGDVISVKEDQLSIVGTIGGCGPAFVDVFLDALGDAGVLNGLPRNLANQLAASMVKGSATLASDSKIAPALLRDQVCSPGGTSLEANGFRHAVIEAVNQANQN